MMNQRKVLTNIIIVVLVFSIFTFGIICGWRFFPRKVSANISESLSKPVILPVSFSSIAEATLPAVINIITVKTVVVSAPYMIPDPFKDFFGIIPEEKARRTGMGSGFFITEDGYILTNNHVVSNADSITITLQDGSKYSGKEVKVIGTDPRTDLALLKIDNRKTKFKYLEFGNSDNLKIGDWVIAEGNPFGLNGTLTVGVVSGKGRENLHLNKGAIYQNYIQTDASINPGNSGGPLINIKGEVIGINSAILSMSGGNIGIGFAVPINMAKDIVEQLMKTGKIERGYLGVYLQNLTDELAKAFGLESTNGVLVRDIAKNSPADVYGIKSGDIIIVYDGKKIKDSNQLSMLVANTKTGKNVDLQIIREGKHKTINVKIGKSDEKSVYSPEIKDLQNKIYDVWGLKYTDAGSEEAKRLGIKADKGVFITQIKQYSNTYYGGIKKGDEVLVVDNIPIDLSSKLNTILSKNIKINKPLAFKIKRGDMIIYTAIKPKK